MSKEELIEVFEDTKKRYETSFQKQTNEAIEETEFYNFDGGRKISMPVMGYDTHCKILVTNTDTLSAAAKYASHGGGDDDPNYDNVVGVLNFASATNPGGGVTKGSSAQEECICRCTNLYPALAQKYCMNEYYLKNRKSGTNLGSNNIIYTPNVLVFKDKNYNMLTTDEMFYTDVITCAAPNLRDNPVNAFNADAPSKKLELDDASLYNIHCNRARNIFQVAVDGNVSHIIVGAFGCGAFKNNPYVVAKAWKDTAEAFKPYFNVIEFAIVGNNSNYDIFKNIILDK